MSTSRHVVNDVAEAAAKPVPAKPEPAEALGCVESGSGRRPRPSSSASRRTASSSSRRNRASSAGASGSSGRRKRPAAARKPGSKPPEPRSWCCPACGGETDVRESMARCSHCGTTQWASYLLLPAIGVLLLLLAIIGTLAWRESWPLVAGISKWAGLGIGTFVSWLGWYILILDLTRDRIVLVWLMTLALSTVTVVLARVL